MQVTYVGPFNPDNGRNRSITRGLRAAGLEVIIANNNSRWRAVRYLRCAQKALTADSEVLIYGARGNRFGQPLSPVMSLVKRRVVVFDAVLSLYETFVVDRKHHALRSPAAKLMHELDRMAFASADIILSDSQVHSKYYSSEFGMPLSKFETVYIGTDDSVFYPRQMRPHAGFVAGFWGAYVPLQGVETIVEAASLLKDRTDITFRMNGSGQMFPKAKSMAEERALQNVEFVQEWVPYDSLPEVVADFDVCLGIFGPGSKTHNVIPNKVYEGLAMAKPVITADTPAARELLTDRKDCLLVPPDDAHALADAILKLKEDPALRENIANEGYALFRTVLSPSATGGKLAAVLKERVEGKDRRG
jgi:glycosyltransferase involved in cell wall biosynthesis